MLPGQPDLGQQQWLDRIRKQPDLWPQARHRCCDAQVEQGGAAGDVRSTAIRIRRWQHPCRIQDQFDHVAAGPNAEPPRARHPFPR
jgi:hypothetical protein